MLTSDTPLLELGKTVVTAALLEALRVGDEHHLIVQTRDLAPLLARHEQGDWGKVDKSDARENDRAVKTCTRVLSAYTVRGVEVWIISDAASDLCERCWTGSGPPCEPEKGVWRHGVHFRPDLPSRRLSTTCLLPSDY
jgi:hypothetical protein